MASETGNAAQDRYYPSRRQLGVDGAPASLNYDEDPEKDDAALGGTYRVAVHQ